MYSMTRKDFDTDDAPGFLYSDDGERPYMSTGGI